MQNERLISHLLIDCYRQIKLCTNQMWQTNMTLAIYVLVLLGLIKQFAVIGLQCNCFDIKLVLLTSICKINTLDNYNKI